MRAFFYNFRQFTDPITFLDLLIKRFHLQPPTGGGAPLTPDDMALWTNRVLLPVRLRVYNVIKTWLESFFYYETDGPTEKTLVNFVTGPMMQAMASPAKRMMDLVRKRVSIIKTVTLNDLIKSLYSTHLDCQQVVNCHLAVNHAHYASSLQDHTFRYHLVHCSFPHFLKMDQTGHQTSLDHCVIACEKP